MGENGPALAYASGGEPALAPLLFGGKGKFPVLSPVRLMLAMEGNDASALHFLLLGRRGLDRRDRTKQSSMTKKTS